MGSYTIFLDVRKSYEWQTGKKFYNKSSENSRSQIVFRTDIFRKLTLGAPALWLLNVVEDVCYFLGVPAYEAINSM